MLAVGNCLVRETSVTSVGWDDDLWRVHQLRRLRLRRCSWRYYLQLRLWYLHLLVLNHRGGYKVGQSNARPQTDLRWVLHWRVNRWVFRWRVCKRGPKR